jgi:hypothetical protein
MEHTHTMAPPAHCHDGSCHAHQDSPAMALALTLALMAACILAGARTTYHVMARNNMNGRNAELHRAIDRDTHPNRSR